MITGKILFIDDDNFLRKVYQTELKDKGFEVALASNGIEGLEKILSEKPDIVILDLIMPGKSGFEVLGDMQANAAMVSIPVIVLSNLAQSDDQKHALDLGAVDYLVKDNTTLDIIADKVEYYIQLSRSNKLPAKAAVTKTATLTESLVKKVSATPVLTQQVAAPVVTTQDRGHNYCPTCGYRLSIKDKFCPDCGTKII